MPLRYFVFKDGSFKAPTGAEDDYCARIEVWDPFDAGSPAVDEGWGRYRFINPTPLFRWNLDHSRIPAHIWVLKPDSTFEEWTP